jgi:hypothetical protein
MLEDMGVKNWGVGVEVGGLYYVSCSNLSTYLLNTTWLNISIYILASREVRRSEVVSLDETTQVIS